MKTLEANSISIGSILGEIAGIGVLFQGARASMAHGIGFHANSHII